jgi:G3E family GTPase
VERLLASDKKIDHIIIEASGMSEPLPVAQSFLMNTFEDRIRLDSIICLIDAENFRTNVVQNTQTATEQLEFADIIVMNKVDLVSEKEKEETLRFVRTINRAAPIFEANHGKINIRYLIDTHAFILTEEKENEMNHHKHNHDNSFSEFLFQSSIPFDMQKLKRFIFALPIEVFRIK